MKARGFHNSGAPSGKKAVKLRDSRRGLRASTHRPAKRALPSSAHADPEQERETAPPTVARTGIVSVNGRDVEEMCCTGGRGSE